MTDMLMGHQNAMLTVQETLKDGIALMDLKQHLLIARPLVGME